MERLIEILEELEPDVDYENTEDLIDDNKNENDKNEPILTEGERITET